MHVTTLTSAAGFLFNEDDETVSLVPLGEEEREEGGDVDSFICSFIKLGRSLCRGINGWLLLLIRI
jgi:hypothetical protein